MATVYTIPTRATTEAQSSREALGPAKGILHGLLISGCMWLAIIWGVSKLWR
jgi:hypothetical protein